MRLPLRYAGGKSRGLKQILDKIPPHVTHLVSPFIGGGAVEVACANQRGIKVTGYDIFDILVNYWQVQLREPIRLAWNIRIPWKPDKENYTAVKTQLRNHWEGKELIYDEMNLAAHYWFNHNLSYGPSFLGWMSKIYTDQARVNRMIDRVANFHCPNLQVEKGDFTDVIPKHKKEFLYCDPPYYLDGDSKMFKGIYPQRNFPIHHKGFKHEALRDLLLAHKGGFVLSYNDCTQIREWYASCEIHEVKWHYSLGQGETRIGKNRIDNGTSHVKRSHELLIVSH